MFYTSELDLIFHRFDDVVVAGELLNLYNVADKYLNINVEY